MIAFFNYFCNCKIGKKKPSEPKYSINCNNSKWVTKDFKYNENPRNDAKLMIFTHSEQPLY